MVIEPARYTLGGLVDALKAQDPTKRVRLGFANPHSYRGDYTELAFEPAENVTVADMLASAESAVGTSYEGWKGGDFTMDTYTPVHLAIEGRSGETLGHLLLTLMLEEWKLW